MRIFTKIEDLRRSINAQKRLGKTVGFVPTMGALHEGHLTLMRQANAENDITVASIFVNPTQFNDKTDLEKYPRTFERDCELLKNTNVHMLFAPNEEEMYPKPIETTVDVPSLSNGLIGKLRPGHFQGMASVVTKLLNISQADHSYFGEKDFQQLTIIKRMVFDLNIPTKIIGVPIVREQDGLAMSSRNTRLTSEERAAAPIINKAIQETIDLFKNGVTSTDELKAYLRTAISMEPMATIKSIDIVDSVSLAPIQTVNRPAALLVNVEFGDVILIDQAIIH